MKAKGSWKRSKAQRRSLDHPATGWAAERAVFVILGITAILGVVVAVLAGSVPAGSQEQPLAALKRLPVIHYIASGQLKADLRTATAMVNYYFESEEPVHTNALTEVGTMQSNVAEYTPTSLSRGRNPL